MTLLEDRLRQDLPLLASALVDGEKSSPVKSLGEPSADETVFVSAEVVDVDRPGMNRRALIVGAAAVLLVIGTVGVARSLQSGSESEIAGGSGVEQAGTWQSMSAGLSPRSHTVAAWTGEEVIFWAGSNLERNFAYSDGQTYDPVTDTWSELQVPGWGHPGLGGVFVDGSLYALAKGGVSRYNYETGEWLDAASPTGMFLTNLVEADGELWAVGPAQVVSNGNPGIGIARYDSVEDVWVNGPVYDAPGQDGQSYDSFMNLQTSIMWSGSEIVIWFAEGEASAYDPSRETWREFSGVLLAADEVAFGVSDSDGPGMRISKAVVTDVGMVELAQFNAQLGSVLVMTRWDADREEAKSLDLPVSDLSRATVAAAGDWVMILQPDTEPIVLNPESGEWTQYTDGPLAGLEGASAVWTGTQLVVWGGVATPTTGVPNPPEGAIWTAP